MNFKVITYVWGIIFVLIGILGFLPGITVDGHLLGLFMVDPIHNSIHILTGLIALAVAHNFEYSKWYFRIFGIVYGLVTIAGFLMGGNLILMQVNNWDNLLHLAITLVALFLGFVYKRAPNYV